MMVGMRFLFRPFISKSKAFAPVSKGVVSDVLLWLVLIVIVITGSVAWYSYGTGRFQRLNLTLGDANEIVVGSNVYFTGVHVGEVEDITLQKDGVQVELKLRPNTPPLPQALTAHIIFSGLAGTKQIHLWPKNIKTLPVRIGHEQVTEIDVDDPIRFRDTLQANTDIALALKDGADGMSKILSSIYVDPEKPDLPIQPEVVVQKTQQGIRQIKGLTQDVAYYQQTLDDINLERVNGKMQDVSNGLETLGQRSESLLASKPLEQLQTSLHRAEAIAKPVHQKAVSLESFMQSVSDGAQSLKRWVSQCQPNQHVSSDGE